MTFGEPVHPKSCSEMWQFCLDEDSDEILVYIPEFRSFSIRVPGSGAIQNIYYCPWCGEKLPEDVRDLWFEEMTRLFGEDFEWKRTKVPEEYEDETWWRARDL